MTKITKDRLLSLIIQHGQEATGRELEPDTDLEGEAEMDSLDRVEIILALEGELEVDLGDFDTSEMTTPAVAAERLLMFLEAPDDE